jgi:hypothetical protein
VTALKLENRNLLYLLISAGYCRVSDDSRIISRIDDPDWMNKIKNRQNEWKKDGGLENAFCSNMSDHYRRTFARDSFRIEDGSDSLFYFLPESSEVCSEHISIPELLAQIDTIAGGEHLI